jgi:hypothetical protein
LPGQYSDVFPEDLPNGLPPERSVELNINLVPDAKPVKRPIYKLSTAELKEVKTPIDDLWKRDLSILALAFGAAPFFSYRKNMVDSVCALTIGPSIKLRFETITRFLG